MLGIATLAPLLSVNQAAWAQDRINFGLDWKAEAEYGGYYQALATGLYARRNLSVTIHEGGPQINHMQLLMAGRLDLNLGAGARSSSRRRGCRSWPLRRSSNGIWPS